MIPCNVMDNVVTRIQRIMGTPNEEVWPSVSSLPDYKPTFPQWSRQDIARIVSTLDEAGIDMLKVFKLSNYLFIFMLISFFFPSAPLNMILPNVFRVRFFTPHGKRNSLSYLSSDQQNERLCTLISQIIDLRFRYYRRLRMSCLTRCYLSFSDVCNPAVFFLGFCLHELSFLNFGCRFKYPDAFTLLSSSRSLPE